MVAAQEQLKHEEVEASAGGGMVTVKVSGDLVVKAITIDPRPSTPTTPSCCRTWSSPPSTRRCAQAQELAADQARRPDRRHGPGLAGPAGLLAACTPPPVQRLITELGKLPGIGQRTAQRLAFHILRADAEDANALADAIREVKERIGLCEVCFNLADEPRCRICQDERRDAGLICVVEEPGDVIPIERTHEYRGRYHVLGGALSPIDGVDPEDLKIAELYARVRERRAITRGRARHEPDDDRRGDRAAHRRGAARARARRRRHAPGLAACRSAPTSSTPTRSRSARPSSGRRAL